MRSGSYDMAENRFFLRIALVQRYRMYLAKGIMYGCCPVEI